MRRVHIEPRPDWSSKLHEIGFTFHSSDGAYWTEEVCYAFTAEEIACLESATADLHRLCLQAVHAIIAQKRYDELAIPAAFRDRIRRSWVRQEPTLYGRFDLVYAEGSLPKLLEYNADTPTALIEASLAQWFWLGERYPALDQFNALHDKLIARWRALRGRLPPALHFASIGDCEEDDRTVQYLQDTAAQAGFATVRLSMGEIGWVPEQRRFVDLDGRPIHALFKLYPWEWMMREEFGPYLLAEDILLIEPAWKTLLSNKGLLAILWELFPDHPNLLPAFFDPAPLGPSYVRKPLFSREGGNVTIITPHQRISTGGPYGEEGFVYQAFQPLPDMGGGAHAVIGSWIVGDEPAGIGIREDRALITTDGSRFVPHYFTPALLAPV